MQTSLGFGCEASQPRTFSLLLLNSSASHLLLVKVDGRRTEEKLEDLLTERLFNRLKPFLLFLDFFLWKVVHMIGIKLESQMLEVVSHVRYKTKEIAGD